jgi:hypothetical protein
MRDQGKNENTDNHDDEQETRSAPGVEVAVGLDSIHSQGLTRLKGKDRFVLCPMIFENPSNLLGKRNQPEVSEKDHEAEDAIDHVEKQSALRNERDHHSRPFRQVERNQKEQDDTKGEGDDRVRSGPDSFLPQPRPDWQKS